MKSLAGDQVYSSLAGKVLNQSEDCLTLNVWTPTSCLNKPGSCAVMVTPPLTLQYTYHLFILGVVAWRRPVR